MIVLSLGIAKERFAYDGLPPAKIPSMDDGRNIKLPPPLSFSRSGFSRNSSYLDGPTNVTKAVQSKRNSQVMSLCAYCIKVLSLEEVHNLPDLESCWTQRSYESATMKRAVAELLPFLPPPLLTGKKQHKSRREPFRYKPDANDSVSVGSYIGKVHPQLWGLLNALIIPSTLPPILRHFSLPITDEHVPSLQASPILSTPTLSLLTHVSFSSTESRIQITDSSLIQLRNLSCLTVLDLAATPVTSSGVLRLIASMRALLPSKASPWRLRVLDLRRTFVDDEILLGDYRGLSLMAFPLLFAIGNCLFLSLNCTVDSLVQTCGRHLYRQMPVRHFGGPGDQPLCYHRNSSTPPLLGV